MNSNRGPQKEEQDEQQRQKSGVNGNAAQNPPENQQANNNNEQAAENNENAVDMGYQGEVDAYQAVDQGYQEADIPPVEDNQVNAQDMGNQGVVGANQAVDQGFQEAGMPPVEDNQVNAQDMGYQGGVFDNQPVDQGNQAVNAEQTDNGNSPADMGYANLGSTQQTDNAVIENNNNQPTQSPQAQAQAQQIQNANVKTDENYVHEILRQNGFTNRIDVKSGVTGTIGHYQYTGQNPEINKIADASLGNVLVKIKANASDAAASNNPNREHQEQMQLHAMQTYKNEEGMVQDLAKNPDSTRPMVMAVTLTGKIDGVERQTTVILNQALYADKKEFEKDMKDIDAKIPKNQQKIEAIEAKLKQEKDPDEIARRQQKLAYAKNAISRQQAEAIKSNLKNTQQYMQELGRNSTAYQVNEISAVFDGAQNAINKMNKDGYLHLDAQPRNFVTQKTEAGSETRLIDFGATRKCNENGLAIDNKPFPLDPVYFYNQAALNTKDNKPVYSIQTDQFSTRMMMIESLAYYAGANHRDVRNMHMEGLDKPVVNVADGKAQPELKDADILIANSDEARLKNSVKNLETIVKQAELNSLLSNEDDKSVNTAKTAIAKYKEYLTSPLPQGDNKDDLVKQNQEAYSKAAQNKPSMTTLSGDARHDDLVQLVNRINGLDNSAQKCDEMIQLVSKNDDFLNSYGPKTSTALFDKLQTLAVTAAKDPSNPDQEKYADLAVKLKEISNSRMPPNDRLKAAGEQGKSMKAEAVTEGASYRPK